MDFFNNNSSFFERLQCFMTTKGINDNKLTIDAGLSVGLLGKARKTGKSMTSTSIEKILLAYPDLNAEWLLTGRGEMIKGNSENNLTYHNDIKTDTRPRIPFDAAAGSLSVALGSVTSADCEQLPVIPNFPRYDFTILARGCSMEPQYLSGDELACLFVTETSFIQWGRTHVLDTSQGIVVKRIFDNGDSILCKSNNPEFPDFSILKSEIYRIALVVGHVRIE